MEWRLTARSSSVGVALLHRKRAKSGADGVASSAKRRRSSDDSDEEAAKSKKEKKEKEKKEKGAAEKKEKEEKEKEKKHKEKKEKKEHKEKDAKKDADSSGDEDDEPEHFEPMTDEQYKARFAVTGCRGRHMVHAYQLREMGRCRAPPQSAGAQEKVQGRPGQAIEARDALATARV